MRFVMAAVLNSADEIHLPAIRFPRFNFVALRLGAILRRLEI